MQSVVDTIKLRKSVRTFSDQPISPATEEKLVSFLAANSSGPFGSKVRFVLLSVTEEERNEIKSLGTYGMITGAPWFIVGAVSQGEMAMEDYGFCMERIVLFVTSLGLGTCWLGGTFKRSAIAKRIHATASEVVPAIVPLGFPALKASLQDSITRFIAGSKNRKRFSELFFSDNPGSPLVFSENNPESIALECVRLAPSASNKQPWRIIKESRREAFHFYLKEDRLYNSIFRGVKIQNIDIGISMCHFEAAAEELGIPGKWSIAEPSIAADGLTYRATWS